MGRPIMNRLTVICTGALMLLALGCKDLTLGPKDQVSDASFWKNPDQYRLAANDFYFALRGTHNYTELNSDIATGSGNSLMSSMSNGSYLPPANDTFGIMPIRASAPPTICWRKPPSPVWGQKSIGGSARRCSSGPTTTGTL